MQRSPPAPAAPGSASAADLIAAWTENDWSQSVAPADKHDKPIETLPPIKTWRDTIVKEARMVVLPALYTLYLMMAWWFTGSLPTFNDGWAIVGLTAANIILATWVFPGDKPADKHHDEHPPTTKGRIWSILRYCWLPFILIPGYVLMVEYHTFYPGQPDKAVLENFGTWWNLFALSVGGNIIGTWWLDMRAANSH